MRDFPFGFSNELFSHLFVVEFAVYLFGSSIYMSSCFSVNVLHVVLNSVFSISASGSGACYYLAGKGGSSRARQVVVTLVLRTPRNICEGNHSCHFKKNWASRVLHHPFVTLS